MSIPTEDFYDDLQKIYNIFNEKLFADKLPNCLIPSSTGAPGGKKTGQNMNDYPLKNGLIGFQKGVK